MTIRQTGWYVTKLLSLSLLLTGCWPQDESLQAVKQRNQLVVVTRNAPTTYYELHDEATGPEYDLARAFAKELGVKVRFEVVDSIDQILEMLKQGKADLAAAGLSNTTKRQQHFIFGPGYQTVKQQVVCRRGGARPNSIAELTEVELMVASESSYIEQLKSLQQQHPDLNWKISESEDTEQLLEKVWEKKLDCTIADSNIVDINQRYYPELSVRFDLSEEEQLAWLFPGESQALRDRVEDWLDDYKESGALQTLLDRYYGFVERFDYVDTRAFKRRIEHRLPKYRQWFQQAAKKYQLDWTLLAAQSYQESHWRRYARSPTGVRGIMMLTLTTAKELGVKSRLNPEQSIWGGARYLSHLRKRLPESIEEPDRTWMALAAYNVGMGHLYDARKLARRQDKDPDLWRDLAEVLPLLSQKKHYKTLKHGYARGSEAVNYVQSIRDYQDILQQSILASSKD